MGKEKIAFLRSKPQYQSLLFRIYIQKQTIESYIIKAALYNKLLEVCNWPTAAFLPLKMLLDLLLQGSDRLAFGRGLYQRSLLLPPNLMLLLLVTKEAGYSHS